MVLISGWDRHFRVVHACFDRNLRVFTVSKSKMHDLTKGVCSDQLTHKNYLQLLGWVVGNPIKGE